MQSLSEDSRSARAEASGPGRKCCKWKEPQLFREESLGHGFVILLLSAHNRILHAFLVCSKGTNALEDSEWTNLRHGISKRRGLRIWTVMTYLGLFPGMKNFHVYKRRSILNLSENERKYFVLKVADASADTLGNFSVDRRASLSVYAYLRLFGTCTEKTSLWKKTCLLKHSYNPNESVLAFLFFTHLVYIKYFIDGLLQFLFFLSWWVRLGLEVLG